MKKRDLTKKIYNTDKEIEGKKTTIQCCRHKAALLYTSSINTYKPMNNVGHEQTTAVLSECLSCFTYYRLQTK